MTKRKMDCELDDIVMEYLKKVKYEKTSKIFGTGRLGASNHSKSMGNFIKFLQRSDKEQNHVEDDLGFEINFGAFQPVKRALFYLKFKLPSKEPGELSTEKKNQGLKIERENRKKDIPKEFMKKIENLGMNAEDAEVLFISKIDWTAVYSENKIYCVEPGCSYFTKITTGELTNHMINVHKYADFPCDYDYCDYVAYSKKSLNYHGQMHTMRSENNFWYKCKKPNCQSTFKDQSLLDHHMRIHNNELFKCQYCPYRYAKSGHYGDHLNKHFRIKDHKCDNCGLKFTTRKGLTDHSSIHEGITYCCLICNTYEIARLNSMKQHLRRAHSDLLGNNINWHSVKEYVKLK